MSRCSSLPQDQVYARKPAFPCSVTVGAVLGSLSLCLLRVFAAILFPLRPLRPLRGLPPHSRSQLNRRQDLGPASNAQDQHAAEHAKGPARYEGGVIGASRGARPTRG
jgi:hypothetical protein